MGIELDKDCITRPDESKLCYDIKQQKFILFTKKEITGDDISNHEMIELLKLITKNQDN